MIAAHVDCPPEFFFLEASVTFLAASVADVASFCVAVVRFFLALVIRRAPPKASSR